MTTPGSPQQGTEPPQLPPPQRPPSACAQQSSLPARLLPASATCLGAHQPAEDLDIEMMPADNSAPAIATAPFTRGLVCLLHHPKAGACHRSRTHHLACHVCASHVCRAPPACATSPG
eukprot:3569527-Amphidinium_carterae.2